jgi:hypothetical protein
MQSYRDGANLESKMDVLRSLGLVVQINVCFYSSVVCMKRCASIDRAEVL